MSQANFAYSSPVNDAAGLPLTLSIFADRADLRAVMREDAEAAGLRLGEVASVARLLEGEACALGDIVFVDCPEVTGAMLAALARLDLRVANCGARLVVSTSVDALDGVFACMDQSSPQLLVDPSRAERVIALGRVLAQLADVRLRELSEEDRLMLLRLTEQVTQIAQRLDRLSPLRQGANGEDGVFRFEAPRLGFFGANDDADRLTDQATLSLPEPRLVRQVIRQRQLRARFFDGDLFADPAWDMLLDLTAARGERKQVSVTSLCIASGVPPTTALRWIGQMTEAGLFQRVEDDTDRRRAFITLTDRAASAMALYFAELGEGATSAM